MSTSSQPELTLPGAAHDGGDVQMPAFGLGTWKSEPEKVYAAVRHALEIGYDCAAVYGNEEQVGRALEDAMKAGDIEREDLWVTSKLWNDSHLPDDVRPACEETLTDLRLDYVDLYLVHWPVALKKGSSFPFGPDDFLTLEEAPLEDTWQAMASLHEAGLARTIGVSNMGPERLARLSEVGPTPAMDQVESHPFLQQRALLAWCGDHDIGLTAYSPLGSGDRAESMKGDDEPSLLEHPVIGGIAEAHDATPGQVLIAWALQRGTSVIPKSTSEHHIEENLAALDLELTADDMGRIGGLDREFRYVDGSFWCKDGTPYDIETLFS